MKNKPTRRRARRGVSMMMVMSVVSTTSILSWAMLSSSTMRSQVDMNAVDAIEANYLAESGVSYAMYYLRYPSKSPVALSTGTYDSYYPGQSGLQLWPDARGAVDVTVTNTGKNTFLVKSTSVVSGTRRTVAAEVKQLTAGTPVTSAIGFNGPFTFESNVNVTGSLVSQGTVGSFSGHLTPAVSSITPTNAPVTPDATKVQILLETGVAAGTGVATDRTYTVGGKTYVAEKAPTTVLLSLISLRPALNPYNVWYSDANVTLAGSGITGTLVLRNDASLTVQGTNTITPVSSKLPALVVSKDLTVKHVALAPSKFTVTGVTWVGSDIKLSGSRSDGFTKFDGALMMGGTAPKIAAQTSPLTVTYNSAVENVTELSTDRFVTDVQVKGWKQIE